MSMEMPIPGDEDTASRWKGLYIVGGVASLVLVLMIPIQSIVYFVVPPPQDVVGFFRLFEHNWFAGLLDLDLLYLFDNVLMILVLLALYVALRRSARSAMVIALALGLVGIAAYYSSNPAFEMLSLSNQYAAAATEAQRSIVLAAGQAMLASYTGTAYDVYYILNAAALLIIAIVMLRSTVFSKATGWLTLAAAILMIVPPTAGTVGMVFAFASLVPVAVYSVMVALRLFRLSSAP